MSSQPKSSLAPPSGESWDAAAAAVRRLIETAKEKTALDRAKDLHKARNDAASEALLLDCYAARIQSLSRQNLHLEARALLNLVRERFPAAAAKFDMAADAAAARAGEFDKLLPPLADPQLPPERRAALERLVE